MVKGFILHKQHFIVSSNVRYPKVQYELFFRNVSGFLEENYFLFNFSNKVPSTFNLLHQTNLMLKNCVNINISILIYLFYIKEVTEKK